MARLVTALAQRAAEFAEARHRADLADELRASGSGLEHLALPMTLVGPSDSGKSSLLNALLNCAASPVDPTGATSLPLIVRASSGRAGALLYVGDVDEFDVEDVDVEDVATVLLRHLDDPEPSGLLAAEISLDRGLLRRGAILVDVPSLRRQGRAPRRVLFDLLGECAVVVVLDASQELDQPWVDLLRERRQAGQWCAVVFTKADLCPHWRGITDAARNTLAIAGLDVPVVTVSSTLRRRALRTGDRTLNVRSGFPDLVELLLDRGIEPFRRSCLAVTVAGAQRALTELRGSIELGDVDPGTGPSIAERFEDLAVRHQRLHSAKEEFPRRLQERLEQLQFDFDALVARSLRDLNDGAQRYIDTHDPATAWSDLTAMVEDDVEEATARALDYLDGELGLVAGEMSAILGHEIEALTAGLDRGALHAACANVRLEALRRTRGGKTELALDVMRGSTGASALIYGLRFPLNFVGLSAFFALPIGAVFTLMLGRKTFRAVKESRITMARRQAQQQFGRYFVDLQAELTGASRRLMTTTRHRVRESIDRQFLRLARALEADRQALAQLREAEPADAARRKATRDRDLDRLLDLEKVAARLRFHLDRPSP